MERNFPKVIFYSESFDRDWKIYPFSDGQQLAEALPALAPEHGQIASWTVDSGLQMGKKIRFHAVKLDDGREWDTEWAWIQPTREQPNGNAEGSSSPKPSDDKGPGVLDWD